MDSRPRLLTFVFALATVLVPASASAMASAELYRTQAYTYGRFDARIQFAPGDGVVSAFFLWKEGSDAANAYWNELDYEKIGADCHMQLNNIYGNPKTQHQQTPSLSSMCTAYHDYRFEWTPTYIAWVVDGKEIRRDTGADATAYAQNASAGMTFHFNIWPGNSSFGGNINNTTLPVHQYISWVQYSSYDNGNFNVQWREDFQSSGIPSGWAVGNWSSPFSLSTHNPQNVAFVNDIAVLSLTADNATGNPGTPPVDNSAGGAGGAGGGPGSGGAMSSGGAGGSPGSGGAMSSGGAGGSQGSGGRGTGGMTGAGGSVSTGGRTGSGGSSTSGTPTGAGGTTGSGGSSGTGGTTASGGATTNLGGNSNAGGASPAGGATASGGSMGSGGATGAGGTTESDGTSGGGSTGTTTTSGGCSCSTAPAASPSGSVLAVLFAVVFRLRRKVVKKRAARPSASASSR